MIEIVSSLKKDDEWYTPKYIVDYFGKFDYDPATTKEKAKEHNIPNYDTIKTNGLKQDWTKYKRIWINPPFTEKKEFLEKAVYTYLIAKNEIYITLPVSYLVTGQFCNICLGGKIYIPDGRIRFEKWHVFDSSPTFGCVIVKIQDKWEVEIMRLKDIIK